MISDYKAQKIYAKEYTRPSLLAEKKKEASYVLGKTKAFFKKKLKVLDVGCGAGVLGSEVAKHYASEVYGLDINKLAVKQAGQLAIKASVADLEKKWPVQNAFFDVVLASQVIEHLINTDNLILEAKRVLKKGGLLIITTPNLACWFNRLIFLFGFQPFFTEISLKDKTLGLKFTRRITNNRETVGHIRVFTLKGLIDLLEYHNLKIKSIKGGSLYYLPPFMKFFDGFFSWFPSLAADLIIVSEKSR